MSKTDASDLTVEQKPCPNCGHEQEYDHPQHILERVDAIASVCNECGTLYHKQIEEGK